MTHLTTSKRISLLFMGYSSLIIFLFGLIINLLFFGFRRRREQRFAMPPTMKGNVVMPMNRFGDRAPKNIFTIPVTAPEVTLLADHRVFRNLVHLDDNRYVFSHHGELVTVNNVTHLMNSQFTLLRITLGLIILFWGLGYVISRSFVRRSLRDLRRLAKKVRQIDIDGLHADLSFAQLPADDEIQQIARAIQEMNAKLHQQVMTIRQFVSNVSHEFKTPLMALQSSLEVAQKTNEYQTAVDSAISSVGVMNRLLETMLALSLSDKTSFPPTKVAVRPLVEQLREMVVRKYDKQLSVQIEIPEALTIVTHHWSLERILTNLLDNACKFSASGDVITVTADKKQLTIADQGNGISSEDLLHIREPFRQADRARSGDSFGLGLAIVKQLIDYLGRRIEVMSELDKWTVFTIYFRV